MYLSAKVHAKQRVPIAKVHAIDVPTRQEVHATNVPTHQEVHAKQSEHAMRQRERCIISDHQWSRVSEGGNDSANECH